ncbi:hypothetical protein ElyMa_004738100 [Elysia marginata]|uniref:Uncharacterized protein n=1 Tax=Elysia marginata TaxID=1093978 RepID=A0AAV4IF89_9GAST|nr:hypothetical protein ElyMa_004738100 [Elysia marginata]
MARVYSSKIATKVDLSLLRTGIYPQGQYNNHGNMHNPYYYNPYANPWNGYGYQYNNQMMPGPGGYNPHMWQGHPTPHPHPNANGNMNGGVMAGRNSIAGNPGGAGGGYNHNQYNNNNNNNMRAWQAAQTQSWLYPMFLLDMMF